MEKILFARAYLYYLPLLVFLSVGHALIHVYINLGLALHRIQDRWSYIFQYGFGTDYYPLDYNRFSAVLKNHV